MVGLLQYNPYNLKKHMGTDIKSYVLLPQLMLKNVSSLAWSTIHTKNQVSKAKPKNRRGKLHMETIQEIFGQYMSAGVKWNDILRHTKIRKSL